jgi:hypothetical protein
VLVVIPFMYTYSILIFSCGIIVVEILFTYKGTAPTKTYIRSIVHLMGTALVGVFVGVDYKINSQQSSNSASIVAMIVIVLLCFGYVL